MYVCMYVCMHACMHACMYACMHVCMCMYVCMYVFCTCGSIPQFKENAKITPLFSMSFGNVPSTFNLHLAHLQTEYHFK